MRKALALLFLLAALFMFAVPASAQCPSCGPSVTGATAAKDPYPKDQMYMSDAGYARWMKYTQSKVWISFKEALKLVEQKLLAPLKQ